MRQDPKQSSEEYCEICKNHHDFILPADLFEALINHELVLFAGAGISTESRNVFPVTLYEDILSEIDHSHKKEISFSKAMTEFCKNRGDRREIIDRIMTRINYVRSFPSLYRQTVEFHRRLAMIPCIKEIVTTNWDDFFEIECHATPFVYEQDMGFWDKPQRKVLKLHGSVNNLGSMVITFEDYEKKYQSLNTGLVGSQLKLLIANKKLVFIGYSFGDEDFDRIYSYVRTQLGDLINKSYIVTLDKLKDNQWEELGLEPIYTAGEYFLQVLQHKLELRDCLLSDSTINRVYKELDTLQKEHARLARDIRAFEQPEVIYCLSYQDGIIHAFEHFSHHVNYGESLCKKRIHDLLHTYEGLIEEKRSHGKWFDVAYLQGYLNGYLFVLVNKNEIKYFPRYLDLSLGRELRTFNEYVNSLGIIDGRRKTITKYAVRFTSDIPDKSIVVQHTPFLL